MDKNYINLSFKQLNSIKLINISYNEIKTLDHYSGWQWDARAWGKYAIYQLLNDTEFKKYNINKFSGSFSDFFYLPKRYLTNHLFRLFDLFEFIRFDS
jgi:hypothetical protein